jgi:predicted DNA-binding transcriptional regulator YafY
MPLKVFSHHETIYLSARLCDGGAERLFALHRLKAVEITATTFEFPADYDFEAMYNRNFGIIKGSSFAAVIEFEGFAATYVAERSFSPDQLIEELGGGRIRLSLSSSSEPELLAWVLSFGREAEVVSPAWLRQRLGRETAGLAALYAGDLAAGEACANFAEQREGCDDSGNRPD